ncbi:uncharacterized protein LOC142893259 [Nelusetta ayraudi]|uniref:uncharacterized protein LOC142893259 n=1 Tax=Nelusetta ayraudi TaxID=303726 RepID=UPI003F6FD2AB
MSSQSDSPLMVLIAIVAPAVCICVVILVMLVFVYYRQDAVCCCLKPRRTEHSMDDSPHYHSRHSLIGTSYNDHRAAMAQGAVDPQLPGRLFIVGKPNHYHLSAALPRLPSYDSVRKQDRQRQVDHAMISQRFGLGGGHEEPPPPTYDETIHPSLDFSHVHLPSVDAHVAARTQGTTQYFGVDTQNQHQPSTGSPRLVSSHCPAQSSSFLSI